MISTWQNQLAAIKYLSEKHPKKYRLKFHYIPARSLWDDMVTVEEVRILLTEKRNNEWCSVGFAVPLRIEPLFNAFMSILSI